MGFELGWTGLGLAGFGTKGLEPRPDNYFFQIFSIFYTYFFYPSIWKNIIEGFMEVWCVLTILSAFIYIFLGFRAAPAKPCETKNIGLVTTLQDEDHKETIL